MNKLDIYKNENYILNDAFDQAVVNIHIQKEQNGYKTYTICGCEPGDGSTTVAINLAAALANSGWKTVLVDGDMRKKNAYKRLNEGATIGLADYLTGQVDINDVIYETTTEMLYYIPSGEQNNNPVRLLCSTQMEYVQKLLADNFDFVIYDMPAVNAAMDATVVAVKSDACMLVVAMGESSKKGLMNAVNILDEKRANLLGVIVNKVDLDEYKRYRRSFDYFNKEKYAQTARAALKANRKNDRKKA